MLGQPTQTGSGKLNLRSGVDLYFVVLGLQSKHTERQMLISGWRRLLFQNGHAAMFIGETVRVNPSESIRGEFTKPTQFNLKAKIESR